MSAGKVLLGVLAGVAAGAVLGILLAPEKGSETRSKISKKGDDYINGLKEKMDGFLKSVGDVYKEAEADAEDLIKNGKEKAKNVKSDLSEIIR